MDFFSFLSITKCNFSFNVIVNIKTKKEQSMLVDGKPVGGQLADKLSRLKVRIEGQSITFFRKSCLMGCSLNNKFFISFV